MTEEQIIGAFEHLIYMHKDKEMTLSLVDKTILDDVRELINRKNAEMEKALATIDGLINGQETLQKYIAEKDAEIERLEKARQRQAQFLGEERGQKYELLNKIGTAKSEAIKEFAEKVNLIVEELVDIMFDGNESKCKISNCHKHSSIPCESPTCIEENKAYWKVRIFNLVKEMEGAESDA